MLLCAQFLRSSIGSSILFSSYELLPLLWHPYTGTMHTHVPLLWHPYTGTMHTHVYLYCGTLIQALCIHMYTSIVAPLYRHYAYTCIPLLWHPYTGTMHTHVPLLWHPYPYTCTCTSIVAPLSIHMYMYLYCGTLIQTLLQSSIIGQHCSQISTTQFLICAIVQSATCL